MRSSIPLYKRHCQHRLHLARAPLAVWVTTMRILSGHQGQGICPKWLMEAISHCNKRLPAPLKLRHVPFISPILGVMFHKHINRHPTFKFSSWVGSSDVSEIQIFRGHYLPIRKFSVCIRTCIGMCRRRLWQRLQHEHATTSVPNLL
eukprot:351106-Chlamydomonas_euryale.AAC.4